MNGSLRPFLNAQCSILVLRSWTRPPTGPRLTELHSQTLNLPLTLTSVELTFGSRRHGEVVSKRRNMCCSSELPAPVTTTMPSPTRNNHPNRTQDKTQTSETRTIAQDQACRGPGPVAWRRACAEIRRAWEVHNMYGMDHNIAVDKLGENWRLCQWWDGGGTKQK